MFKNMKIFLSTLSTVITLFIKSITHRHLSSVLSSHHSIVQLLLTTNSFYSQFPLPSQTNLTVCSHGWMGRMLKRM